MELQVSAAEARFRTLIQSDLWFDDGNIVLIVGSSAFKVHRGQLSRQSEVFDNLFSIPQPADQLLYEGTAWVELYDNSADVFYFLTALYDGLYFSTRGTDDFPAIAAVLRLSTKYLVEHLRRYCMMRLEFDWPATLPGWDRREKEATCVLGPYTPRELFPHPVLVIALAQELGLDSILSSAFYDLSRYGPSAILLGSPCPVPPVIHSRSNASSPTAEEDTDRIRPSHDLLYRIFRGRESAQHFVTAFIETELKNRPISADCTAASENAGRFCRESFYFIMLNVLRCIGGIAVGRDADPLYTLTQSAEMLNRTDFSDGQKQCGLKICESCKVDYAACVDAAREDVWNLIPGWFGLAARSETLSPLCG